LDGATLQGVEVGVVEDGVVESNTVERGLGDVPVTIIAPPGADNQDDGPSSAADGVCLVREPDLRHDDAVAVRQGRGNTPRGGANPERPVAFADAGAKLLQELPLPGKLLSALAPEVLDDAAQAHAPGDQRVNPQRHLLKLVGKPAAL